MRDEEYLKKVEEAHAQNIINGIMQGLKYCQDLPLIESITYESDRKGGAVTINYFDEPRKRAYLNSHSDSEIIIQIIREVQR